MIPLADHSLSRVILLDCGTFSVRGGDRIIGIPAFVLETDEGARILVDGGFPAPYWLDPPAAARADGLGEFGELLDYGPDQTLPGALARAGLRREDIALHILTHGHVDHVGALGWLACPLVLTAAERADPRPRYFGKVRPVAWPEGETHLVAGETRLCRGITLIPTPGHTPGHLSLFLQPAAGPPLILAADAINRASEPDEGFPDAEDSTAARLSADRLFRLQRQTGARMVYGHDPAQWHILEKAPAPLA